MERKNITPARAKESEKTIEKKLSAELKKIGGKSIKLPAGIEIGMPDRLLLYKGLAVFAETKTTGEKLRKAQIERHMELRAQGFAVLVIDSVENAEQAVHIIRGVVYSAETSGMPHRRKTAVIQERFEIKANRTC